MGCTLGRCHAVRDIPRLIALWQAGRLDLEALVTACRPLAEVNQAMDDCAPAAASGPRWRSGDRRLGRLDRIRLVI